MEKMDNFILIQPKQADLVKKALDVKMTIIYQTKSEPK